MSQTTPSLLLPYILPSQAQKHVTHNEAIRAIDALVQLAVRERDLSSPPADPDDGARYIVASGASGEWAGQAASVAAWQDGAWAFYPPRQGWLAWVEGERRLLVFEDGSWNDVPAAMGGPLTVSGPFVLARPTGSVIRHDPSVDPNHGGYGWNLFYQAAGWSNGPAGDETYVDDVWAAGINMAAVSTKADPDKQYAAWHMESKFYSNPSQQSPWTENFLHVVDINGGVRRPIAWVGTHDGSYGNIMLSASLINLNSNLAEPKIELNFANGLINVYDGLATTYLANNVAPHRQRNAANSTTIPLPYVDDGDNIVIQRPVTTAPTPGTRNTNGPTFRTRGNINTALTVSAPGATNATMVLDCGITQAAAATPVPVTANGTTTVTMAANAITEADIGRTITGANVPAGARVFDISSPTTFIATPALPATVTEVTLAARTRRSTEISVNAGGGVIVDFTTNYQLRDKGAGYAINLHAYNGKLGFGPGATYPVGAHVFDAAIRLKSYAVGALPSASAAGAGAIIYVTDASDGPALACSDGAAWKVVAALGETVA